MRRVSLHPLPAMRALLILFLILTHSSRAGDFLPGVKRILFLGDSITYAGQYVDGFEAFLVTTFPQRDFEVIDCGLPSETVSGLSEDGHAGGKFPRPDLNERLDRVLALAKPDLVFVCYGMNCGIYLPFDDSRFGKFQQGIHNICDKVKAAGAKVVLITPPVFDAHGKPGFNYDSVLMHYSSWLIRLRNQGTRVVNAHGAMWAVLDEKRATNPDFTFAKDGVHPDKAGHLVIAKEIVTELATQKQFETFTAFLESDWAKSDDGKKFFGAISSRRSLLSDAYLTASGHTRPEMAQGKPLTEALKEAEALSKAIRELAPKTADAK